MLRKVHQHHLALMLEVSPAQIPPCKPYSLTRKNKRRLQVLFHEILPSAMSFLRRAVKKMHPPKQMSLETRGQQVGSEQRVLEDPRDPACP